MQVSELNLTADTALIVVDVQHDFLPGGALAVPAGDTIIPVLNRYIQRCRQTGCPLFFTRDWHPADHCSFRDQGGTWPVHCVAGTAGAELSPELNRLPEDPVISKATERERDAYSGFDGTELGATLQGLGVKQVLVGGLATDYCVFHTVKDSLANGFMTYLLIDACRGVNLQPGDVDRAIAELTAGGAQLLQLEARQ